MNIATTKLYCIIARKVYDSFPSIYLLIRVRYYCHITVEELSALRDDNEEFSENKYGYTYKLYGHVYHDGMFMLLHIYHYVKFMREVQKFDN